MHGVSYVIEVARLAVRVVEAAEQHEEVLPYHHAVATARRRLESRRIQLLPLVGLEVQAPQVVEVAELLAVGVRELSAEHVLHPHTHTRR